MNGTDGANGTKELCTRLEISARILELQFVLVGFGPRVSQLKCRIPLMTLKTNPLKHEFFSMN